MLKGIFKVILSCVAVIVTLATLASLLGMGIFAHDVYCEVERIQTPAGALEHTAARFADEVGLRRQSPYKRTVDEAARNVFEKIHQH